MESLPEVEAGRGVVVAEDPDCVSEVFGSEMEPEVTERTKMLVTVPLSWVETAGLDCETKGTGKGTGVDCRVDLDVSHAVVLEMILDEGTGILPANELTTGSFGAAASSTP